MCLSELVRDRLFPSLGAVAVVLLCGSTSAAAASTVRITAEQRTAPRVVTLTISTPAFTTPTKVDVDLPTDYESHPHRRWPVTYILAGTMNTYRSFNSVVSGVKLTKSYPSIIVSPTATAVTGATGTTTARSVRRNTRRT